MKNFFISIITIAVLVASGSIFYYYVIDLPKHNTQTEKDISAIRNVIAPDAQQQGTGFQNTQGADKQTVNSQNTQEVQNLVTRVGKLMSLPTNETPTLATVTDPTRLKDQSFFANAQIGDKVLVYTNAKKAILYRPSTNKVISVAPINVGK